MSKLRIDIEIDADGGCVASMTFCKQELEGEGSTPSEALQSLAETLALYEQEHEDSLPEEVRREHILQEYMS